MTFSRLRRLLSGWLFWSVISAAFIGPGTVTTAAQAGASHETALLWALVFSTLATLVLQEAAARIPLVTGFNLGEAIAQRMGGAQRVRVGLAAAVIFGCTAYQTGNILGAVQGLGLVFSVDPRWLVLPLGLLAGLLLWQGQLRLISRSLGLVVAAMGLLFLGAAWQVPTAWGAPSLPVGSEWLVIALVGTTIVPYNLFLGSGLSHGQSLSEMRRGLAGAVLIGGLISMVILLVGTQVEGDFSFAALAEALEAQLGGAGRSLLALGLFAAGFTSAVTAPLASSLTAAGLLGKGQATWQADGRSFRLVWGGVLLVGVLLGLLAIQPIPAIILAQALNGILLPLVVIFLYFIVNDPQLMPPEARNRPWLNGLTLLVLLVVVFLGGLNVLRAAARVLGQPLEGPLSLWLLLALAGSLTAWVAWRIHRRPGASSTKPTY